MRGAGALLGCPTCVYVCCLREKIEGKAKELASWNSENNETNYASDVLCDRRKRLLELGNYVRRHKTEK